MDTQTQQEQRDRRQGGRRVADLRTANEILNWHIKVGSWVGHVLFITVGLQFAWFLGGYGGAKFFEVLFLMDLTGPFAAIVGMLIGVTVGILSIWGILVIVCSAFGALAYWLKNRSFPSPMV